MPINPFSTKKEAKKEPTKEDSKLETPKSTTPQYSRRSSTDSNGKKRSAFQKPATKSKSFEKIEKAAALPSLSTTERTASGNSESTTDIQQKKEEKTLASRHSSNESLNSLEGVIVDESTPTPEATPAPDVTSTHLFVCRTILVGRTNYQIDLRTNYV